MNELLENKCSREEEKLQKKKNYRKLNESNATVTFEMSTTAIFNDVILN